MEFSKLGVHCAKKGCSQLDFLPFECKHCHGVFCLDHRDNGSHECVDLTVKNKMPKCPLCGSFIHVKPGEDPDTKVNAHISRGCKGYELQMPKKDTKKCYAKGCKNPNKFDVVRCKSCRLMHCLTHRFPKNHACAGKPMTGVGKGNKPASSSGGAGQRLLQRLRNREPKQGKKKNAATEKVRKMQQQHRAVGDEKVSKDDRFFLDVKYAASLKKSPTGVQSITVFFDRNHTVGKALDIVCKHTGIVNRNNEVGAKRLGLYARRMSAPLPYDIPLHLLHPQLSTGDTVTIAYVPS